MAGFSTARKRCRSRLPLAIACVAASGAVAAADPAVWAIGLPHGYIVMEHQVQAVDVTDEDVARGFVEIRGGSRIVVTTRSGGGYALDFARRGMAFSSAQVEISGRTFAVGPDGGTLAEHGAPAGRVVFALNYRFHLAPETAAGTYAWPLDIVARRALPVLAAH